MHLAQHHFQTQARYFETAIHFAVSGVFPASYGFLALELDEEALWDGTVAVRKARGVLPDGLIFDLGEEDALPPARDISSVLGKGSEAHLIHLSIPAQRSREANCRLHEEGDGDLRFRAEELAAFDETTGSDERRILVATKNFSVVLEGERPEVGSSLPMARVRSDRTGHLTYDSDFIPPCLRISASRRLMLLLERIVERMESKARALRGRQPGRGASSSEMAQQELTSFWLTHAIYSTLGTLRYRAATGDAHPRELYREMVRLAGALCTFSLEADPSSLPEYDHDRPGEAFFELDRSIRSHLDVVLPESCIVVPLVVTDGPGLTERYGSQVKPEVLGFLTRYHTNLHTASLDDERMFGDAEWVLGVRARVPLKTLLGTVPKSVKVSSAVDVMRFVAAQDRTLDLEHLPSPPSALSPRVGSHYFRIRKDGPAWALIKLRRSVGVYAPDILEKPELELRILP